MRKKEERKENESLMTHGDDVIIAADENARCERNGARNIRRVFHSVKQRFGRVAPVEEACRLQQKYRAKPPEFLERRISGLKEAETGLFFFGN